MQSLDLSLQMEIVSGQSAVADCASMLKENVVKLADGSRNDLSAIEQYNEAVAGFNEALETARERIVEFIKCQPIDWQLSELGETYWAWGIELEKSKLKPINSDFDVLEICTNVADICLPLDFTTFLGAPVQPQAKSFRLIS